MTTTMDRWNPFREMLALRDVVDRVFEDTFYRPVTSTAERARSFPIDLAETDHGFLLRATLPGVTPEQVQITIHGETLTIRSLASSQEGRDEHHWIIRERGGGNYHRLVTLPAPVNPDQAEAHFKDGILELTLPKAEAARPRQIKVATGAGATAAASTFAGRIASNGSAADATGPGLRASASETDHPSDRPGDHPKDEPANKPEGDDTDTPAGSATGSTTGGTTGGTASATPANPPQTHPDKDAVTEASEESMAASDPPSWTQERT